MRPLLVLILTLCMSIAASGNPLAAPKAGNDLNSVLAPKAGQTQIIINIPELKLRYYVRGKLAFEAPIAVGSILSQTKLGDYFVANKAVNPTWFPPDGRPPVPHSPRNPLGTRWMGLDRNSYGIHGNANPSSIGHAVSMGCIRMHNRDVEKLFDMVSVGTPVKLAYERIITSGPIDPSDAWVTVFPDVYKKTGSSIVNIPKAEVEKRLAAIGLQPVFAKVDKDMFWYMLETSSGNKVYLPFQTDVYINGQKSKIMGVNLAHEVLLPLEPIATHLGLSIGFNKKTGTPTLDNYPAAGAKVLANRAYINPVQLERLLGITATYKPAGNSIELNTYSVTVGGRTIEDRAFIGSDGLLVPLRSVCNVLGISLEWDRSQNAVWPTNRPEAKTSSYRILAGRAYMNARMLQDFLGVMVGLDEIARAVEIENR